MKLENMMGNRVANSMAHEKLITDIRDFLMVDSRFAAAWLEGSYGRGDQDSVSDVDLRVVVSDPYVTELCAKPHLLYGTTPERLELISRFGTPAILHESHHNAAYDGTFTFCLYAETALAVDWVLYPESTARRSPQSVLLFDKINVPLENPPAPESLNQRIERASEQTAFFWMMSAVTVKYLIRGDEVAFHEFLNMLHGILAEVRRVVVGEAWQYKRGSYIKLLTTRPEQLAAVRTICQQMLTLMPDVEKMGGVVPENPMPAIELLISIFNT